MQTQEGRSRNCLLSGCQGEPKARSRCDRGRRPAECALLALWGMGVAVPAGRHARSSRGWLWLLLAPASGSWGSWGAVLRAEAGGCLEAENTGLGSNLSYKFLAV